MQLIDMHCDTISKLYSDRTLSVRKNTCHVDLEKLSEAGAAAQFFACFIHAEKKEENHYEGSFFKALDMLDYAGKIFSEEDDKVRRVETDRELSLCMEQGRIGCFLTIEEGGILEGDLTRLDTLKERGVSLMTFLWNYENSLGYPNSTKKEIMQRGLKPFGRAVTERMNEIGMIVDVSHLSDGGFYDVAAIAKKPFVASHSNARALCNHPRNLTDDMIRTLAAAGGICGVNFYPRFLTGRRVADVEDLVRHIRYLVNKGGEDMVAFGSDFDGFDDGVPDPPHIGRMDRVFHAMKKAGITERQMEKIAAGNVLRIIKEVL